MALSRALGAPLVHVAECPDGRPQAGPVALYGNMRGLKPILDCARAEGRDWYYADNGYFRPGHWDGYFSITKNALQHAGSGRAGPARFARLGLTIQPWRRQGAHILIAPPSLPFAQLNDFDGTAWIDDVLLRIRRFTDRPIIIRRKARTRREARYQRPLIHDLADAWCVVTYSSKTALHALLAGVPIFATTPCAASAMGLVDLSSIEAPAYPAGRAQWAANLAANQWTLEEIERGAFRRQLGL